MEYAGPILGIVIFLIFIGVFARMLIVGAASRHWPMVSGTVRKVTIEEHYEGGRLAEYSAHMRYDYVFEGRTYGNRRSLGESTRSRKEVEGQAQTFAVGQQLTVYVDDKNPRRCTFEPGLKFRDFFWLTFSVGMLIFFLFRLVEVLPR